MYYQRYLRWLPILLIIVGLWTFKASIKDSLNQIKSNKQQQEEEVMEEKFITYLPHSGLHNQRIALINAMILAKALDRTLLMPEINLGHAIYWRPSSTLSRQLDICPRLQSKKKKKNGNKRKRAFQSLQCHHFKKYVPVPVETIFDLSAAQALGIRTEQRLDMKRDYTKRHNRLFQDHKKKGYRYSVPDTSRYSYRLHDGLPLGTEDDRFSHEIDIQQLKERPERYIEFGSLFSTARLSLNRPELIWAKEHLHRSIGARHPLVQSQAQKVIQKLGGAGNFISVHLRQGDGHFKRAFRETLRDIETKLPTMPPIPSSSTMGERLEVCLSQQVIFLATDAPNPRKTLKRLFQLYPCTFTLADFIHLKREGKLSLTDLFENSRHVGSLLYPMMDAEIASHASLFIGTPKSTYSSYVQYRNQYHRIMDFFSYIN